MRSLFGQDLVEQTDCSFFNHGMGCGSALSTCLLHRVEGKVEALLDNLSIFLHHLEQFLDHIERGGPQERGPSVDCLIDQEHQHKGKLRAHVVHACLRDDANET